ncbi:MAG: hypothetical protein A3K46_02710 [Chloroflexi bacterium RBG_13_60_9]|nr:MAG: hypothetical protein A3K46_02710 [Chloroflexi bacterium RBG_13_60_9]
MNAGPTGKLWIARWILLGGMFFAGCGIDIGNQEGSTMKNPHLMLYEGGQFSYPGKYGRLFIAAGNYQLEEYVTEKGEKNQGWTLILWMGIENRPETSKAQRVYIGQTFFFEKYKIHVVRMDTDGRGLFTEIEILNA